MPVTAADLNLKPAYDAAMTAASDNRWDLALPYFARIMQLQPGHSQLALFLGFALFQIGQREQAAMLWSLASDKDPMVRAAWTVPGTDPFTAQASRTADRILRETLTGIQDQALSRTDIDPGRIASAIWPQTHTAPPPYKEEGPRPHMFYAPDLPPIPVFERDAAEWSTAFEALTEAIREEYLSLVRNGRSGTPYVDAGSQLEGDWSRLTGQDNWQSFHLFRHGTPTEFTPLCPVTCDALSRASTVLHNGHPMEAFFSVLRPGTHIPPHYGLANCRLTVHLPLIIPDHCMIRVGTQTHHWKEGELFLFDDSFDHEARNDSDQTRVVLIFEAWRPDMSADEITAVERSYAARDEWLKNRKMPDLEGLISGAM